VANHGFSEHGELELDEVKEQNLVIRSQSKSRRTSTRASSKNGECFVLVQLTHVEQFFWLALRNAAEIVRLH
jgi:hypothetical protein